MWTDVLVWLSTYLLHSTALLGVALLVSRLSRGRHRAAGEAVFKAALIGGILTTALQLGLGVSPLAGAWSIPTSEPVTRIMSTLAPRSRDTALSSRSGGIATQAAADTTSPRSVPTRAASPGVPGTPSTASPQIDVSLVSSWIAAAWGVTALALLLLLLASHVRLRFLLANRRTIAEGPLRDALDEILAERPEAEVIRLSSAPRLEVPIALGILRPEICLPERVLTDLTPEQRETLLAHEAAHLVRRDPLWLLLSRLVEALLFVQPLNRLAGRRLRDLAEDSCDDWTIEKTGRPLALARCLTEVAAWQLGHQARALPAPMMARGRSGLDRRVRRLLNRRYPLPARDLPGWLLPLMIGTLGLMVVAAPGVTAANLEPPLTPRVAPAAPPTPPAPVIAPEASPQAAPPALEPVQAPASPAPAHHVRLAETPAETESVNHESGSENEVRFEEDSPEVSELRSEELEEEIEEILEDFDEQVDDLEEEIDEWEDQMDERYERRRGSERKEDSLDETIEAFEDRVDERTDDLEDRLEAIEDQFEDRLESRFEEDLERLVEHHEARLEERLERSQHELERLERNTERLADSGRLTETEVERIRAESERLALEARPSDKEMTELQRQMSDMARDLEMSSEEIAAARAEIHAALETWKSDYEAALAELDASFDELKRKHD